MAHVLRVPKFDLSALLSQQNPQIDLNIEYYEASTRNFLEAVANYTHKAQTEMTQRKNSHLHEKKRLLEKIQSHEQETNACKVKELELIAGAAILFYVCVVLWRLILHNKSLIGNEKRERRRSCLSYSSNAN